LPSPSAKPEAGLPPPGVTRKLWPNRIAVWISALSSSTSLPEGHLDVAAATIRGFLDRTLT
jgi:hypothetical protein